MRRQYVGAGLLTLAVALACIFLPARVLSLLDGQRLGQIRTEETQKVVLSAKGQLGLAGKVALLTQEGGSGQVDTILLNRGKNYTMEDMETHVWEELHKLQELGTLPGDMPKLGSMSMDVYFCLNIENGEESMIFWSVTLELYSEETGSLGLGLLLDDETGKIISLATFWSESLWKGDSLIKEVETEEDWKAMAEGWGEYLGCHLVTIERRAGWQGEAGGSDSIAIDGQVSAKEIETLRKKGLSEKEIKEKLGITGEDFFYEAVYRQGTDSRTFTCYLGKENGYFYISLQK